MFKREDGFIDITNYEKNKMNQSKIIIGLI